MNNNNIYNISYTYIPSLGGGIEKSRDGMHMSKDSLQRYRKYLCGEYTKQKTIISYYTSAKKLQQHTRGNINPETLQDYKRYVNQHYKKQNSRRLRLHGANQYLKWLQLPYKLQLPPEENTNQKTLNEQQMDTILEISRYNPEVNLVALLLWDGCLRPETITNLKLTDRNDKLLQLHQTKTGDKHIVMSKPLIDAWDNYLQTRPQPKPEYQEYLLINNFENQYRGEKYHSTYHIIQTIKTLGVLTQIPYKITPYTIRRTSATLRQNKFSKYYAGDPKLVQRMFNHTDIRTTMKYNQLSDNDVQKYLDDLYITSDKSYISPQELNKTLLVENEDNAQISFSVLSFETFFVANVVGAGVQHKNPPSELSFFVFEPPSNARLTPSPTLPIDAYLDDCDYGRAYFTSYSSTGVISPHLLQTLPDHVGGDLQPLSFPSSSTFSSLLNLSWGCNKNVTRYTKMGDVGCNTILGLSYLKFTIVYTKV